MPTDDNNKAFRGLTSATQEVFEQVSGLECIKDLFLCGGTGQSLQMDHRLSEDLDFELLGIRKNRPVLDFNGILGEIKQAFPDAKIECRAYANINQSDRMAISSVLNQTFSFPILCWERRPRRSSSDKYFLAVLTLLILSESRFRGRM